MAKHKKYSILEFAIPLGNYDANQGVGYGKITNGPRGKTRMMGTTEFGIYDEVERQKDLEDDEEEYSEDEIDVSSKVGLGKSRSVTDIGRRDPKGTSYDNVGYASNLVHEKFVPIDPREDSKNPGMTNSITPGNGMLNTTTNAKGPSMSGMANAPYIKLAPGRIHGTEKGTSRAPAPLPGEENLNPIFSLEDILEFPEEYNIRRLQRQKKEFDKVIKEIFLKFWWFFHLLT